MPTSRRGTLVVEPVYGLGNRLGAVFSALVLAEEAGADVKVRWAPHPRECNAHWGDLFLPSPELLAIEPPAGPEPAGAWHAGSFRAGDEALGRLRAGETVEIRAFTRFGWSGLTEDDFLVRARRIAARLTPTEAVRALVPAIPAGTLGLHLRGTDHWMALRHSPPHLFVAAGRAALARGDARAVLVVADDAATRRRCIQAIGSGACGSGAPEYRRTRPEAIQAALADILALAACARILGAVASSFVKAAQLFGSPDYATLSRDGAAHPWPASWADRLPPRFLEYDQERRTWRTKPLYGWRRVLRPVSWAMLAWAHHLCGETCQWRGSTRPAG